MRKWNEREYEHALTTVMSSHFIILKIFEVWGLLEKLKVENEKFQQSSCRSGICSCRSGNFDFSQNSQEFLCGFRSTCGVHTVIMVCTICTYAVITLVIITGIASMYPRTLYLVMRLSPIQRIHYLIRRPSEDQIIPYSITASSVASIRYWAR